MQSVVRSTVVLRVSGVLALLGIAGFFVGLYGASLGMPEGARGVVVAVGIVTSTVFGLLWLGSWVVEKRLTQALAAMKQAGTLGSWSAHVDGCEVEVDVGSALAIIDGKVQGFALHNQRVVRVEVDTVTPALRVHSVYNNGNGDFARKVTIPFDAKDLAAARTAGDMIADRHSVEVTAPQV